MNGIATAPVTNGRCDQRGISGATALWLLPATSAKACSGMPLTGPLALGSRREVSLHRSTHPCLPVACQGARGPSRPGFLQPVGRRLRTA